VGDEQTPEDPAGADATASEVDSTPDFSDDDFASAERGPLTRRERWQRRTATGAILSGLALGFQQVFEAPKDEVSIVMETSGTPPRDLPVEAEFDEMVPRRSVVKIRPWLLADAAAGTEVATHTEAAADPEVAAVDEAASHAEAEPVTDSEKG
jgi:hypothetical protein